ncbi:hypothetical protein Y032_0698g1616 [Ancylostoma ceylanicum]|uniref:Uncharacterized protein n=1 Tax=Ancylostoma ceylanicum TaxID=53326 RepID=A0A016WFZ1_9BILA|nr:hypothetical protein Y032_0698g1616 [Ancylostoma ceylanicum]
MPARFLRFIIVVRPGAAQRRVRRLRFHATPPLEHHPSTRMDRKDIEDFLRRSNSICDQTSPELGAVNVRRMSLKEFTGLDNTKEEVT